MLKSGGTHTRLSLVIFYHYYFLNFRDRLVFLLVFFFVTNPQIFHKPAVVSKLPSAAKKEPLEKFFE